MTNTTNTDPVWPICGECGGRCAQTKPGMCSNPGGPLHRKGTTKTDPVGLSEADKALLFKTCGDDFAHALLNKASHKQLARLFKAIRRDAARAEPRTSQEGATWKQLVVAAEELADLMEAVREGEYTPDSFTCQPIRVALKALAATPKPQEGAAWPHDGKDWVLTEATVEEAHRNTGIGRSIIRAAVRGYIDAASPSRPLGDEVGQ